MAKDTKPKSTTTTKTTPKAVAPKPAAPKPVVVKAETPKPVVVAPKVVTPKVVTPAAPDPKVRNKKIHEVCEDIMANEFFVLSHAEAHPIAIKMVDENAEHLRTVVKYFSYHEREKLCNELAQKHNLTRSK